MNLNEAQSKLVDLCKKVTAHQTNQCIIVWHSDDSLFKINYCYYEEDENWYYVIPEHNSPMLFHKLECKFIAHPNGD